MKVHLPFRYRPLNDPDLGLRLPFGVDPVSLNHFSSFPSGHAMLLCPQRSAMDALPLVGRSGGRLDIVGDLFAAALSWRPLGKRLLRRRRGWRVALMLLLCRLIDATGLPDRVVRFSATHPPGVLRHCVAGRP